MPDILLLMDTDIVSYMGRKKPPPGLRPWLLKVGIHRLGLSYPVIAELMRGAHLRQLDDPERAARITVWVDRIVAANFPMPEMSHAAATTYARMTSIPALKHLWTIQKRQKSTRLGHDVMIAALAITYQLPILTVNIPDYLKIHEWCPLPGLYHPLEAHWHVAPPFEVALPPFDRELPDPSDILLPKIEPASVEGEQAAGSAAVLDRPMSLG
ncbi:type II toxin-antitoxin system VapC family toxin [Rhizobium laguerreae]|uniref:type II toxin-antitoxin system VapC family toxin n=1 Tax=Rhizobium laguerreae TaxID=1076926 RepID=UPI0028AC44D4|nr:type II toxin-antitoxin system VapC family toxin [Rhizobium laguerreae]